VVACLSLIGFPFLSGFYSKDLVLEAFLNREGRLVLFVMIVVSTCLTAFYSGLMLYSVGGFSQTFPMSARIVSRFYVVIPCSLLGVGALFGGLFIQSVFLGFNVLFYVEGIFKLVPILCVMVGLSSLLVFIVFRGFGLNYFTRV